MTEHTPTPWAVEENCLGVYPLSARQGPLTVHPAKAFGEADAAFIVKAVNNHDALVEALKHAKARFECLAEDFKGDENNVNWAMCSVDAERMTRALASVGALQQRGADGDK